MKRFIRALFVLPVVMVLGILLLLFRWGKIGNHVALAQSYDQIQVSPIQSQTKPVLFSDRGGTVFEWSNHVLREHGESNVIEQLPSAIIPVDNGVGFIKDHCLYHWTSSNLELIAENVSIGCWDGSAFLWLANDGRIISGMSNDRQQIVEFDLDQLGEPVLMVASEKWIILGSFRNGNYYLNSYIYDRQKKLGTAVSLSMDGRDYAVICDDKLIKIGGLYDTFCCLDLNSLEKTSYDSGIVADQGDVSTSTAYDKTRGILYVSVNSRPELPDFYEENAATFAVDLQNNTLEILDNQFYSGLSISEGNLYGTRKRFFGIWTTALLFEDNH